MSHFRKIVSYLLLCPPCARGEQKSDGIIDQDVLEHLLETWFSVYDDIRWFFLRDAAYVTSYLFFRSSLMILYDDSTLLNSTPPKSHRHLPSNLLSILVRLTTFPTEQAELNAWWVPELGTKPPKPKYVKKKSSVGGIGANDEEDEVMEDMEENANDDDDWRKFFDSPDDVQNAASAQPRARLHTLTIHQSLHSLESHRAVFTRAWLTLLPRLTVEDETSASKELVLRALNVMHRGVLPYLTRSVLVMDWVGSCIDYGETSVISHDRITADEFFFYISGGAVGLLAFNALFILMKDYNLYVIPENRVRKVSC